MAQRSPYGRKRKNLGPSSGSGGSFLGGFGCRRGLAAALGLGRRSRSFADQFGSHHASDEQFEAVVVEVYRSALRIGSCHNTQPIHTVFDGLTFLHYLHIVLLDQARSRIRISLGGVPVVAGTPKNRLEACNVLRLKALRALLHLELHRLTFIQRLVTVHLDGGEVYENIFSRLTLDEPVTLRSIEPLHGSLFLHFHNLDI